MNARTITLVAVIAALLSAAVLPSLPANDFIRGDVNDDGRVDIGDPIATLEALFRGSFTITCDDAADSNDDGAVDLSDSVHELRFLFLGGRPPRPPFPSCGVDPTGDSIGCDRARSCADAGSPLLRFLEAISFAGSEPCVLPGIGLFSVREGVCEELGGSPFDGALPPAADDDSAIRDWAFRFLVSPLPTVVDPVAPVEIVLPSSPENVALTIDLHRVGADGELVGPVRLVDVPVPPPDGVGAAGVRGVQTASGVVELPADLPSGEYVLRAALWRLAGSRGTIFFEELGPPPDSILPAFPVAVSNSRPFRVGATSADIASLGEIAASISAAPPGDPVMDRLAANVMATGDVLASFDATLSSPRIDRLRSRIRDALARKAAVQRDVAAAEVELGDNRARQAEAAEELAALVLVNRMLDTYFDDEWLDLIEDLLRRRDDILAGNEADDEEALDGALDDKRARLEEVCEALEQKKQDLEDLEARHREMKEAIRAQFHKTRRATGCNMGKLDVEDGGVEYEIVGLLVVNGGQDVIKYAPTSKEYREEKKKLDDMIAEYEELWKKILACREEVEGLENEKAWLEENIERLESDAGEVDEIDSILESWFDILDGSQPHLPHVDDLLEELEEVGADWLVELLRELFGETPRSVEDLDRFRERLAELRRRKHAREAELAAEIARLEREAEALERRIEDGKRRCEEIEDEIDGLEDDLRRAEDDERRRLQEEHDRARQAAEEEARKRREQEDYERRLDELRRRAQEGDADALRELLEMTGLNLLDEVTGDLKLGSLIGAAITIAEMPECVCKILKAMLELFKDRGHFRTVLASEVIRQWRECAGLGWIASVEAGASELAEAVDNMPREARLQVVAALRRALRREECR